MIQQAHSKTSTQMFIAALFIIAETWTQPRCPSVGEWWNKLWYVQTMECYSVLKTLSNLLLNTTHYHRNANQNHNEVPLHASQYDCYPKVYKE